MLLYTDINLLNNEPIIPIKYTYPKSEHLKSRKAIEQLFKSGESVFVYPYKIVYRLIDDGQLKIDNAATTESQPSFPIDKLSETDNQPMLSGFAVSTKSFKHAVDRNRIKRLGKEAFRLNKHSLVQLLINNQLQLQVFFIYTEKKLPDWKLVEPRIQACLKKLIHLTKKHHEKLLQG